MISATLIEGEQPPEDAPLLCTVSQEGHVDWKIDDLVQTPIARATLPRLSEITLPIEEVQFNNVTITIASADPVAAYTALCQALARFEYTTDTFQTNGAPANLKSKAPRCFSPRTPDTNQASLKHRTQTDQKELNCNGGRRTLSTRHRIRNVRRTVPPYRLRRNAKYRGDNLPLLRQADRLRSPLLQRCRLRPCLVP